MWDTRSASLAAIFPGHQDEVYGLDCASDHYTIASASADQTVRLWDMRTRSQYRKWELSDTIASLSISPDSKLIAAGSLDNNIYIFDKESEGERAASCLQGHRDAVSCVSFRPGHGLLSAGLDKTVKSWSPGLHFGSYRHIQTLISGHRVGSAPF